MFVWSASHSVEIQVGYVSCSVGWLARKPRIAQCADTLTVLGDKFVIGEEFPGDPGIGRLLHIGKTGYQKNSSETTLTLGTAITPTVPSHMDPPLLSTVVMFRSLCERTTGCVCPSSVSNSSAAQSNSSLWTQKSFLSPAWSRQETTRCHHSVCSIGFHCEITIGEHSLYKCKHDASSKKMKCHFNTGLAQWSRYWTIILFLTV